MIREVRIAPGVRYVLRPDGEIELERKADDTNMAAVCTPMVIRDLAARLAGLADTAEREPDAEEISALEGVLDAAECVAGDITEAARTVLRAGYRREAGS